MTIYRTDFDWSSRGIPYLYQVKQILKEAKDCKGDTKERESLESCIFTELK